MRSLSLTQIFAARAYFHLTTYRIFRLLLPRNSSILVEAFSYPGTLASLSALGVKAIPIAMDGEGLIPSVMDDVLSGWNETVRRSSKPRCMVIVPTGQNPTSVSMGVERRKEVLRVAGKHDLVSFLLLVCSIRSILTCWIVVDCYMRRPLVRLCVAALSRVFPFNISRRVVLQSISCYPIPECTPFEPSPRLPNVGQRRPRALLVLFLQGLSNAFYAVSDPFICLHIST